jgi:hypothetical protein
MMQRLLCDGVDGKITGRCFELAPLRFVRIRVQGIEGSEISCLADSGSELNVINSNVVPICYWSQLARLV